MNCEKDVTASETNRARIEGGGGGVGGGGRGSSPSSTASLQSLILRFKGTVLVRLKYVKA